MAPRNDVSATPPSSSRVDGSGTAQASTTTFLYDKAGNLLSETMGISATTTYAHASTTSYGYDALNRVVKRIDGYGTGAAATTNVAYDKAGNLLSITDPDSNVTTYAYDSLNRRIEEIEALLDEDAARGTNGAPVGEG